MGRWLRRFDNPLNNTSQKCELRESQTRERRKTVCGIQWICSRYRELECERTLQENALLQYRSLEEQVFRAMAALSDQAQRHGIAKLIGMRSPFNIVTPIVEKKPTSKEMTALFLTRSYQKLPFALPSAEADKQIRDRQDKIAGRSLQDASEPKMTGRKIG